MLLGYSKSTITAGRYANRNTATATRSGTSNYHNVPSDYVDAFYSSLHKWRSETFFCSDHTKLIEHSAFRAIVNLGRPIVPLIIDELRHEPTWLVIALEEITGAQPYTHADAGNLRAITESWNVWFNDLGR